MSRVASRVRPYRWVAAAAVAASAIGGGVLVALPSGGERLAAATAVERQHRAPRSPALRSLQRDAAPTVRVPRQPRARHPHRAAAHHASRSHARRTAGHGKHHVKPGRHHRRHRERWKHAHGQPPVRLPRWGVDVSFPQCRHLPPTGARLVTVGINRGRPHTTNPCLARQLRYADRHGRVWAYLNMAAPHHHRYRAFGRYLARDALHRLDRARRVTPMVWLDVETANHWAHHRRHNRRVIRATVRELHHHGVRVGVYSVPSMWQRITGGMHLHVPSWIATGSAREARHACRHRFAGHRPLMAQYVGRLHHHAIDIDVVCRR